MAQHYKIENWKNEKWYPKIMKRIKWIVKYSSGNTSSNVLEKYLNRVKILPSNCCTDVLGNKEGNLALSYKTKLHEIHSKSRGMTQNKLIQAYIVV